MKKLIAVMLAVLMVASMTACSAAKTDGTYVVGVCQIAPHDALDAATNGFKAALTEAFGDKVTFKVENAGGEYNNCATIVDGFVAENVDLILANATPVLQTAAMATTTIPILGTSVTEYSVALGLENFNGVVGGNISGTSDLAPLDKQADMIMEWFPEAQNIGLLYCATEANSKYQVEVVKAYLEGKGKTVKEFSFSSSSDMAAVTEQAAAWSDVIYVPTDNTVANGTSVVRGICEAAKIPVIAGEEGICTGCGIATLSISYYDLGYTTGKMAAKILKDGADISTMAIEYAEKQTPKYNAQNCQALGITPLEGYTAIEAK